MAVLVEAIAVIVKCSSVESTFRGGLRAFADFCRPISKTFCSDTELACVSFLSPDPVKGFIEQLALLGLVHLRAGSCVDIVVAHQRGGLLHPCAWATMGLAAIPGKSEAKVAACRLVGSKIADLTVPDGWRFATSLSAKVVVPGPAPPSRMSGLAVLANRPSAPVPVAQRFGLRPAKK